MFDELVYGALVVLSQLFVQSTKVVDFSDLVFADGIALDRGLMTRMSTLLPGLSEAHPTAMPARTVNSRVTNGSMWRYRDVCSRRTRPAANSETGTFDSCDRVESIRNAAIASTP